MQSRDEDERRAATVVDESHAKAADVIGLYVNPPDHAAVFAVDEKTAIQALDRLDLVLPLSPGRAERHGFEYYRHGTLSLFAALNTQTGEVFGQTVPRHTSAAFVDLLEGHRRQSAEAPRDSRHRETICRRTRRRRCARFLLEHPNVAAAFHADLFVLAQPSRTLVFEDRAGPDGARHLYVRRRPRSQDSLVSQRLSGLQRVLNALERLALAAQLEKRLALEVQEVLLADRRLMRQRAAGQDVGERAADDRVVIADPAGAPGEVDAELDRRQHRLAADRNRGPRHGPLVALAARARARTPWRRPSAARDSS